MTVKVSALLRAAGEVLADPWPEVAHYGPLVKALVTGTMLHAGNLLADDDRCVVVES